MAIPQVIVHLIKAINHNVHPNYSVCGRHNGPVAVVGATEYLTFVSKVASSCQTWCAECIWAEKAHGPNNEAGVVHNEIF